MLSFKSYALGALVFAAVATIVCLGSGFCSLLMDSSVFAFVPIMVGLFVSGNVHALSEFGLYLGVFIDWLLVGLLLVLPLWLIRRAKDNVATQPRVRDRPRPR